MHEPVLSDYHDKKEWQRTHVQEVGTIYTTIVAEAKTKRAEAAVLESEAANALIASITFHFSFRHFQPPPATAHTTPTHP